MHQCIAHDEAITGFDPLVRTNSQCISHAEKTAEGAKRHPSLPANVPLKLALLFFFALVLSFAAVSSAQTGDVTVQFNGGGANNRVYIGEENTLQIFITNADGPIVGMTLGFGFTSAVPGFSWKSGYGNKPLPGSYNASTYLLEYGGAFDKFGPSMLQFYMAAPPTPFLMGGAVGTGGSPLPVHTTSTILYDLKLIMPADPGNYMDGFCVDNVFVPPAGAWVFDQGVGINYAPTFQGNGNTSKWIPDAPPVCFDIVHRDVVIGLYGWPRRVSSVERVFFTGMNNTVPFDPVVNWDWDFGDGTLPHDSRQNPDHIYSSTGVYTVTLMATLAVGGTRTVVHTDYIRVNPVKADFTASPRYGSLDVNPGGLLVQFTDASTNSTSWLWDFGDGTHGTVQNPTHTYTSVGVYDVSLIASSPGSSDTKTYLNCIRVDAVATPDLQVICYGAELVRKGFHKWFHVAVGNFGSADAAAGTTLTLDLSSLPLGVTFEGSVPPPIESPPYTGLAAVTWTLPTITWDPTQLLFDDYYVEADLNVGSGVSVGTPIQTIASVSQAPGEVVLTNNTFTEHETVVAAIDPNDKSVQPPGCGPQRAAKGTERLNYLIQFENKASATADAFYVLVVDTLDPNLDPSSLQLGPSSKDNVLSVSFDPMTREIVWFFDGYNLPPNVTPPEGEGFVTFSVMPVPGLPENTVISNRAYIRFDFENWLAAPEAGPLQLTIQNADSDHDGIIDPCDYICGNANGDDIVDISDAVYLIAYIFSGGSAPNPLAAGDANCDGVVDISDAVYLIGYIFSGGAAPCAAC